MSSFFSSDRFFGAAAAAGAAPGAAWSRWLSASDLTLAAANDVTIITSPADSGDEITVVTQNSSGVRCETPSRCAIYTFDMSQLDSLFDSTKDQLIDMQLEFSALPNACLLAIGPTNTTAPETTMAVGQYYRPSAYHAIEMNGNTTAVRATSSTALMTLQWGSFISQPDWTEGVVAQIIGTTAANTTSGIGASNDFGGSSTTFAVLLGFQTTADNGSQTTTFKARFAVRDLTP